MIMYCKKCGQELIEEAKFCSNCGEPVEDNEEKNNNLSDDLNNIISTDGENVSPKSRLVAAILAYLLGWVGGHLFYVGKTGKGVLMLIFWWTFVPMVFGIVHFIQILCGVFQDSDGKYLKKW